MCTCMARLTYRMVRAHSQQIPFPARATNLSCPLAACCCGAWHCRTTESPNLCLCHWNLLLQQRANHVNPQNHSFKTLNEVKHMTKLLWAKDHWAGGMCVQQFVAWSIYDCDYDTRILIHVAWPEHSHRKLSGTAKSPKTRGLQALPEWKKKNVETCIQK